MCHDLIRRPHISMAWSLQVGTPHFMATSRGNMMFSTMSLLSCFCWTFQHLQTQRRGLLGTKSKQMMGCFSNVFGGLQQENAASLGQDLERFLDRLLQTLMSCSPGKIMRQRQWSSSIVHFCGEFVETTCNLFTCTTLGRFSIVKASQLLKLYVAGGALSQQSLWCDEPEWTDNDNENWEELGGQKSLKWPKCGVSHAKKL